MTVRSRTCDVRGPMHLLAAGDSGPALMLVHGLDATAAAWLDVVPHLMEDHRVLACDLPGFGRSPRGRHRGSLEAHAALVAELVRREAGGPAVLVGTSMGAVVSLLTASLHPQAAAGVVLLAPLLPRRPSGRVDASLLPVLVPTLLPGMLALEPWWRSHQAPEAQLRRLLERSYAPDSGRPSPETLAAMIAAAAQRRRRDHVRAWASAARSLLWWLGLPERFHEMADGVGVGVTLVEGMQDPLVPHAAARAALDRHPAWEHVGLAGVGHVPHLERPAAVADALRLAAR